MDKKKLGALKEALEKIKKEVDGLECWLARDLQPVLGYGQWKNFASIIEKARTACKNAGEEVTDHFSDVGKMVTLGSGAEREIKDVLLTRYACYLVAQNGDAKKAEVAFAQSYFALQTRKQELIEERMRLNQRMVARKKLTAAETDLSQNIYERGVDQSGFARIRSKGDTALFGGFTTRQMKQILGVPEGRPLADFLPTVTITAKQLATEITNLNVTNHNISGEEPITREHVRNNSNLRKYLLESGIRPEDLPAEEDIRKLERRVKSSDKKLLKGENKKRKGGEK